MKSKTGPAELPARLPPLRLQRGDTVSIVAPAGPVDRAKLERALPRIEARGLRIKLHGDVYAQHGYLAGDDERRVAELNAALADPETTAVFPARGGYGCSRLAHRIDFAAAASHPKLLIGFSDITVLHATLASRAGVATLHSANLSDGWGEEQPPAEWIEEWFWRCTGLCGELAASAERPCPLPVTPEAQQAMTTITGGVAEGVVVGGNAAVLTGLIGAPQLPSFAGKILFLEDVGEQPYRIDRMLSQMRLAGMLDDVAAVLLGQFTDAEPADDKPSLALDQVFADYLAPLGVPVLAGFPTGHVRDNLALPLNTRVRLDADQKTVSLLEMPFAE